jgi:hypothetical protein
MYCSSFARPPGAAAFFTMLFFLLANGAVWAADGLPRHVIPMSPLDQVVHRGFVGTDYFSIHGNKIHMASNDRAPMAYFLDQLPSDSILAELPAEAEDIVIAKVRATRPPSSLFGRDEIGGPPTQIPRDKFFIRIKILETLRGSADVGAERAIYFGEPGRKITYPLSEDQLARDYVAVIYRDSSDSKYRLFGIPISSAQYTSWHQEISSYRRSRRKK